MLVSLENRIGPWMIAKRSTWIHSSRRPISAETDATEMRKRLSEKGYTGLRNVYTGEDGEKTTGPWVVNVLEVDQDQFQGQLVPELANDAVTGKKH